MAESGGPKVDTLAPPKPARGTSHDRMTDPQMAQSAMSVGKALQVLDTFLSSDQTLSLSELARRAELPKSTTFRLTKQLLDSGYLVRCGSKYGLSLHAFELGNRYSQHGSLALREVAAPYLGGLFQHASFLVNLAVLDGSSVVHLDQIHGPRAPRSPGMTGRRTPALATALGKAILAFSPPEQVRAVIEDGLVGLTPRTVMAPGLLMRQLAQTAETGVAFDLEESALGLTCVASPILVADDAVGAISVSGPAGRFNPQALAPLVLRTARQVANELQRRHD